MTWVKLDDTFYDNAKVEEAGFDGAGLYAMALSFCGRHLTDGFVPDRALRKFGKRGASSRVANKLIEVGLWRRVDGGYLIPDYTKENPSKTEVLEKRARDSARKKAQARKDSGRIPDGFHAESEVDSEGTPLTPATPLPGSKKRQLSGGSEGQHLDFKLPDLRSIA